MESLGDGAEPFDCEVLDAEHAVGEVVAFDLKFVVGECAVNESTRFTRRTV